MSKKSDNTLLYIGGAAVLVAAGAAYYIMNSSTDEKPQKKKKNKKGKKNKEKKKKQTESAAAAVPPSPPPPQTTTTTTNTTTKSTTSPTKSAKPQTTVSSPSNDNADDVKSGITRDENGLQISGPVTQEVMLKFFEESDKLLGQQSIKDDLATAFKNGENILDLLKTKQEAVWASLNVEAQFGFKNIQLGMADAANMSEDFKMALIKAASMEDGILTYALLGSQEKYDQEQIRLQKISQRANLELQQDLQTVMQQGAEAVQNYAKNTMEAFKKCTDGFEKLDEIGRLRKRTQLTDAEYLAIVKGQGLQQLMAQQAQQMQQMGMR
jgi:phosphosulfolactate synthase (CoM biosynthesis protein A)